MCRMFGMVAARPVSVCDLLHLAAATFLLSCGERVFAYRCGRTLFTLARGGAMFVASEPLSDEPWTEVPELGTVVMAA